jgi:hypothetical protein
MYFNHDVLLSYRLQTTLSHYHITFSNTLRIKHGSTHGISTKIITQYKYAYGI